MGPRRYRRGSPNNLRSLSSDPSRFNGAATLPSRIACHTPHSVVRVGFELQWGRDVTVADRRCGERRVQRRDSGFNGAATLPSRIVDVAANLPAVLGASMGPRRYRRGSRVKRLRDGPRKSSFNGAATLPSRIETGEKGFRNLGPIASMGPRRYRRGSRCDPDHSAERASASMGPRRYRRGSRIELHRNNR